VSLWLATGSLRVVSGRFRLLAHFRLASASLHASLQARYCSAVYFGSRVFSLALRLKYKQNQTYHSVQKTHIFLRSTSIKFRMMMHALVLYCPPAIWLQHLVFVVGIKSLINASLFSFD
jgi:hypothetical protein